MTRAGAWLGLALGIGATLAAWTGYRAGRGGIAAIVAAVAVLVVLPAAGTVLAGRRGAAPVLALGALILLGRFMPLYYEAPGVWPSLAIIALATATFGFAVLGTVLDRYRTEDL